MYIFYHKMQNVFNYVRLTMSVLQRFQTSRCQTKDLFPQHIYTPTKKSVKFKSCDFRKTWVLPH